MKLVDTDNFNGDYPDEKFYNLMPDLSLTDARIMAQFINSYYGPGSPRYCMVVDNDYKLQPGFEP